MNLSAATCGVSMEISFYILGKPRFIDPKEILKIFLLCSDYDFQCCTPTYQGLRPLGQVNVK